MFKDNPEGQTQYDLPSRGSTEEMRREFDKAGYWPNEVMWKAWQQSWNAAIASKQEEQSLPDYWREGSKKAAIAIDSWKLDIFKRHLKRARIAYSVSDGLAEGMLFITLRYNWVTDIQPIVEAANEECRNEQQDS